MNFKNTFILYVGVGMHRLDPIDTVTVGTTRLDLINCRSNQKTMQIVHVFTLSRSDVTKGQFEYWESHTLSPKLDNMLEKTRVIYDTLSMNGILYVKKEFEAYDKGTTDKENKED